MADEADRTFKWACDKCGACFEETDSCMLEVRIQKHKCKEKVAEENKPVVKCGIIE